MSERLSSTVIEDPNVLALRSRIIDIKSRHSDQSRESIDHDEHGTPRKRQRTETKPDDVVDGLKSKSATEENVLTVLGPKENTDGETGLSYENPAIPSSVFLSEGPAPEDVKASKQQERVSELSAHQDSPVVVDADQRIHKRFQSKEPESNIIGKESDPAIPMAEDGIITAQTKTQEVSNNVSDDEEVPDTFSTNVKQTLLFPQTSKQPRSKRRRPRSPISEDVHPQGSRSTETPLESNVGGGGGDDDNQLSIPGAKAIAARKRPRNIDTAAIKKVKDFVKDGVIYRSVSGEGLRGQTTPWLPAKASPESRNCKERLLVRKRVQAVNLGQRRKFVVKH